MNAGREKAGTSRGFTLIELMISVLVLIVGVVGVGSLIFYGIHLRTLSEDASIANGLARAKVEELRVLDPGHAQRSAGGSLDSDVANHFDISSDSRFVRRWVVGPGPSGTQDITVTVLPVQEGKRLPKIRIRILVRG